MPTFKTADLCDTHGGGSLRSALIGDQLAGLAKGNGWAGAIVYGCIRDAAQIRGIDLGLKALATHPRKSVRKGLGKRDCPLQFAGVRFAAEHYLYADEDGIIVSPAQLVDRG